MRRPRLPPYVADSVLALLLTVPTVAGLVLDEESVGRPWWIVGPLSALTAVPLAARRYRPVEVFWITLAATVAINLIDVDTFPPGIAVASYTLAAHCERRTAARAGAAGLVLLAPALLVSGGVELSALLPDLVLVAAAWLLGDNLRTRRAYLRELEVKAERLAREREEDDRRAAAEEQARIARELHDVIAHNISVMVLQAAGGREVLAADPGRAGEALAAIETTGRDALAELRRLLGAAGADGGGAAIAPQPGLSHLGALVDQVRAAGLAVGLVLEGDLGDLPAGVELSAYRVIQEALTNTLRHASASRAWVFVRGCGTRLEVEVLDDGVGPSGESSIEGRGLVGMRERVAVFGGELETGARADGGFRVLARFPL